ncbi:hypothetical protein EVAR_85417_1 [Eumeta japonica]|uniref:Uncharacterized protein n=1 Tax=Eumeta variegata TaxID=151549 RepID=A0A4C1WID6_EUMVA|nr:hypothetical protein EVAR_85417_1 [Eumeta japonica]
MLIDDIHFVYGLFNGNARAAAREYHRSHWMSTAEHRTPLWLSTTYDLGPAVINGGSRPVLASASVGERRERSPPAAHNPRAFDERRIAYSTHDIDDTQAHYQNQTNIAGREVGPAHVCRERWSDTERTIEQEPSTKGPLTYSMGPIEKSAN